MSNPRLASQYSPGDRIQYVQGSPSLEGIAHNSVAVVLAIDTKKNLLTVQTSAGDEVTYRPHLTKAMTTQSTVYREEQREIVIGKRIQFGQSNPTQGIRKGEFGTVTAMNEMNDIEVRLDKDSTVKLNSEQVRHIDHGYIVSPEPMHVEHR